MAAASVLSGNETIWQNVKSTCRRAFAPRRHPTAPIEAGDFRIDLATRRATLRGRLLHLTESEFDVLVYVVSHGKGLITPRTTLATRGQAGEVRQTRLLPALLSLRKKLQEEVPGDQHLRAETWVLYEFHP